MALPQAEFSFIPTFRQPIMSLCALRSTANIARTTKATRILQALIFHHRYNVLPIEFGPFRLKNFSNVRIPTLEASSNLKEITALNFRNHATYM